MAAFAGERIFAPSAIVVLVMGIAMVLNSHYGFDHFWLLFGLLGFLTTFVLGIAVLGPMSKRAIRDDRREGAGRSRRPGLRGEDPPHRPRRRRDARSS